MKIAKKKLVIILLMGIGMSATSQTITSARFRVGKNSKNFRSYELVIDNSIVVGINEDSEIDYVGSLSNNESSGVPADYDVQKDWRSGRNSNPVIGNYPVKYYTEFDINDQKGKIKSIGNIAFKYNNTFDIHENPGTLKSVGNIKVTYYNTFDIHDPQGNIKSVGNVKITYFNKMDIDESKYGRIKSIKGNSREISVVYDNRYSYGKEY